MTTTDDPTETTTAPESPSPGGLCARRPYRAPKLRALGSVREVTWSGSGNQSEGGFKRMAIAKM